MLSVCTAGKVCLALMARIDSLTRLLTDAAFSQRLGCETEVEVGCATWPFDYSFGVQVIGGSEKYAAVCRSCFQKYAAEAQATPTANKDAAVDESKAGESRRRLFSDDSSSSLN